MHPETPDTISTTELVRNLAVVIDRVRISGRRLAITKGNQTVAELSPPPKAGYPIADLGTLLASLPGLGEGAQSMADDFAQIRQRAALPGNPWDL